MPCDGFYPSDQLDWEMSTSYFSRIFFQGALKDDISQTGTNFVFFQKAFNFLSFLTCYGIRFYNEI